MLDGSTETIKVKAVFANKEKFGFYGHERRYDGDVFYIKPELFSENWMERLEEEIPKPKKSRTRKASQVVAPVESVESEVGGV